MRVPNDRPLVSPPPCGEGLGVVVNSGTAAVATPLPAPPPQGGREKESAHAPFCARHRGIPSHFANSFSPSRINCAVSACSPALRDADAIAAAACGWP